MLIDRKNCGADALAPFYPALSKENANMYKIFDEILSNTRTKKISDTDIVLRRTATVGSLAGGQTVKWTRPAGLIRLGAMIGNFGQKSYFIQSDWMTLEAGKSYEVEFDNAFAGNAFNEAVDFEFTTKGK